MRTALLTLSLGGFAGLGALDLTAGNWRTGIASVLIAGANGLLLAA